MGDFSEILKSFSTMPYWAVAGAVVISGFALAGYAIYAVSSIARRQK
jgi:uncharacterized membrane protein YbhN (UPF0104 family)